MLYIIKKITNCLIYCEIDKEIKNLLNYLLIKTILDFKLQKKFIYCFKHNWKVINIKKFNNILRELLSKSLLNNTIKLNNINKYIFKLIKILEKIVKDLIL